MKKLIVGLFALVMCLSSFAFTKSNEIFTADKPSNKIFTRYSDDINEFLNSYYGKKFQFGKSDNVIIDEVVYTITEVLLEESDV